MFKNFIIYSLIILLFLTGTLIYGLLKSSGEITLASVLTTWNNKKAENISIVIEISKNRMSLFSDSLLLKSYRVMLGSSGVGNGTRFKNVTPVGTYKICAIDTNHRYHKFFRLNYPNLEDAEFGYLNKLITKKEYEDLRFQFYYEGCVTLKTALSGNIGIHGTGGANSIIKNLPFVFNWTAGSIAVTDEDIDELFTIVGKGTKVVIKV